MPVLKASHCFDESTRDVDSDAWRTFQLPATVDDIPPKLGNPKEKCWDLSFRRLWIRVDNQQGAQIFAGLSKLQYEPLKCLAIRVSRRLLCLLEHVWRHRTDTQTFIEWDKREHLNICIYIYIIIYFCIKLYIYIYIFPQTSVALGVLAVLLED